MIIEDFPYITMFNPVPTLNSLIFPARQYLLIYSKYFIHSLLELVIIINIRHKCNELTDRQMVMHGGHKTSIRTSSPVHYGPLWYLVVGQGGWACSIMEGGGGGGYL